MKKFIITESERNNILQMYKSSNIKEYIREDVSAPEPILKASTENSAIFLQTNLPVGSSKITDQTKKEEFLN